MEFRGPRGTQDILPEDIYKWHLLEERIQQFCYLYNYKEIRTPIFEHTNVFHRENDSSDMVNKEMYTFQLQNSNTSLTLRPEMTASVARSFVEHKLYTKPDLPIKMYYNGPMCRHERPQKGRQRIFHQFGVEVLGAKSPYIDAEVITLGWSFVNSLGLKNLKVLINTLGDEASRNAYCEALRVYFEANIDKLCDDCKRRLNQNPLRILDCKVDKETDILKNAPKIKNYLTDESLSYFQTLLDNLDALEIPYEVDEKLVRGLDYYSDTVFEVVSCNQNMGAQSTVFAGGRYDHLIEYFQGPSVSGIGWALGIERLLIACESEGIFFDNNDALDVYVLTLDKSLQKDALKITTQLRAHGFKTEMDFFGRNLKSQFKTVERKAAKYVLFVGEKELKNNQITIKHIATQEQKTIALSELIDALDRWDENDLITNE